LKRAFNIARTQNRYPDGKATSKLQSENIKNTKTKIYNELKEEKKLGIIEKMVERAKKLSLFDIRLPRLLQFSSG